MKESLSAILSDFAESTKQTKAQVLGGLQDADETVPIGRARSRMVELVRNNGYMMHLAAALVIALFIGCVALAVYYRKSPNSAILLMGGNALQLLLLVGWLRRLWVEKTSVEILLMMLEELPPAEAVRTLTSFYFKAIGSK